MGARGERLGAYLRGDVIPAGEAIDVDYTAYQKFWANTFGYAADHDEDAGETYGRDASASGRDPRSPSHPR